MRLTVALKVAASASPCSTEVLGSAMCSITSWQMIKSYCEAATELKGSRRSFL